MKLDESEQDLIARAVAGESYALERLLLYHFDRLAAHISAKLPALLRGVTDAEEILQETFVQAWRHIGSFQPLGADAFYAWLVTIAERRVQDKAKAQRTLKRGGGRVAVELRADAMSSSIANLLDVIAGDDETPSKSAMRHEAEQALHVALAGLKDDFREAIMLRYIEGLAVAEVAARMNRTERAVHMLCNRGKRMLRDALGRSSQYFNLG